MDDLLRIRDNVLIDMSVNIWVLLILSLGILLNLVAYNSIQPVLIGALFLFGFMSLLGLKGFGGREERRAYLLVYSVGWFWAGVAAFMAFANDSSQIVATDADHFFSLATDVELSGIDLKGIVNISEGAGAILVWRYLYDFLSSIGFDKGRYIGVNLNVALVALSAVIGVKIVKNVFGQDGVRIRRFTIVFALCGIFWLFAALHVRDAAVLFAVSLLIYFWVRYLVSSSVVNLLQLSAASLTAFLLFGLLRAEFSFVPFAMLVAGLAAAIFESKVSSKRVILIVVLALPVTSYLLISTTPELLEHLISNKEQYADFALQESNRGSLAYNLILNQPIPIRLVIGFVYMLIFPIPFWVGFQLESPYHLLKSFHALFMYAITPLFILAVWRIIASKTHRTLPILFLFFITVGFTLSIAFTSIETRHLGVFLPALLVITMLPDLTATRDLLAYRNILALFLSFMFLLHLAWIALKFL